MAVGEKLEVEVKVSVGVGAMKDLSQCIQKGYDFIRGAGAGFTAALEGSPTGQVWTSLVNLNASGQGAIDPRYNLLRVRCTGAGAIGTDTKLFVAGLNQ